MWRVGEIFLWVSIYDKERKDNPTVDNTHSKCVFCPWDKLQRPLNGSFFALAVLSFKTIARSGSFHIKSFWLVLFSSFSLLSRVDHNNILHNIRDYHHKTDYFTVSIIDYTGIKKKKNLLKQWNFKIEDESQSRI